MKIFYSDRLQIISNYGNEIGWKEEKIDEKNEEHNKKIKKTERLWRSAFLNYVIIRSLRSS